MARTKGSKSGIHAKKTGPKPKAQKLAQKKEAEGEANRSRVIFSSFLKPASDLDPHNGNADKTDLSLKKDLLENPAIPTTLEIGLSSISSSESVRSSFKQWIDVNSTIDIPWKDGITLESDDSSMDDHLDFNIVNINEPITSTVDLPSRENSAQTSSSSFLPLRSDFGQSHEILHHQERFLESIKKKISNATVRSKNGTKFKAAFPYSDLWVHPPDPTRGFPDLQTYWLQPVFIWIPEFFWPDDFPKGRLPCPNCKIDTHVTSEGWNKNTRYVILQDRCCRLLSFRYKCNACDQTLKQSKTKLNSLNLDRTPDNEKIFASFNAFDDRVLQLMPAHIRSSFPFIMTARSGIQLTLIDKLADDLMFGKGFKGTQDYIIQSHLTRFHQLEKNYYSHMASYRSRYLQPSGQQSLSNKTALLQCPKPFGTFDDADGYDGHYPSEHFLNDVWKIWFSCREVMYSAKEKKYFTREQYLHRRQQLVDGTIWCGDASHKLVKLALIRTGQATLGTTLTRPIHGLFTIMNEAEQVMWQRPLFSSSLTELKPELKLTILKRFLAHGYELPQLYYTDECCEDRNLLTNILQELENEGHDLRMLRMEGSKVPHDFSTCPELAFPDGKEPTYLHSDVDESTMRSCDILKRKAKETEINGKAVLGLDIEWEANFGVGIANPPACIQIATLDGTSFLFHVGAWFSKRGKRPLPLKFLPKSLKNLLEDPNYHFVGVGIKGDKTRLEKSFDVVVANVIDVGLFAVSKKMKRVGGSLAEITGTFLGRQLKKDNSIRLSRWNQWPLSESQIKYACLDAYAGVLCYQHIEKNCDPIWQTPPSDVEIGRKVLLYLKGSPLAVALGIVKGHGNDKTWGKTLIRFTTPSGLRREIIKIVDVKVVGAVCMHPAKDGTSGQTLFDVKNDEILWDVALLRYAPEVTLNEDSRFLPSDFAINDTESYSTPSDEENFFVEASTPTFLFPSDDLISDSHADDDECEVDDVSINNESETDSEIGPELIPRSIDDQDSQTPYPENRKPEIHVRLDLFHAMQRLSRTLLKSHGAFRVFMARFRDAMFLVNTHDVEAVCQALKQQGRSDEEIKKKLDEDWVFFLRYCRRLVPSSEILLKRFDRVCSAFADIKDAKTGEVFFRAKTKQVVKNLRQHIQQSCLSDVPHIPLYVASGKDAKTGMTTYRCIRGTNGTEGYHRHIRHLLSCYCASPRLLHEILMEFNYRWNLRMGIKNRGLSTQVGLFYHQYLLEEVNGITSEWNTTAPYSDWLSVDDFRDTGERTGFQTSIFSDSSNADNSNSIDNMCIDALSQDEISCSEEDRIAEPNLTPSARHLARLQKFNTPALPIRTEDEKSKFFEEWPRYLSKNDGGETQRSKQQSVNFDQWAADWNATVSELEKGILTDKSIFRKTASHLQQFHRVWKEQINTRNTMNEHRQRNTTLRSEFRIGDSTAQYPLLKIRPFPSPPTAFKNQNIESLLMSSTQELIASQQCASTENRSELSIKSQNSLFLEHPMESQIAEFIDDPQPSSTASELNRSRGQETNIDFPQNNPKRRRRDNNALIRLCQICGHIRKKGKYAIYHKSRTGCEVPMEHRRQKCDCEEIVAGRKRDPQHYHRCECPDCNDVYNNNK